MSEASKIISSAIIGSDVAVFVVNSKRYVVQPPTIHKIAGAISVLSDVGMSDKSTLKELLLEMGNMADILPRALSWIIKGNESLSDELSNGTSEEVVNGIDLSFGLISTSPFLKAASLAKNVTLLAAKPKQ